MAGTRSTTQGSPAGGRGRGGRGGGGGDANGSGGAGGSGDGDNDNLKLAALHRQHTPPSPRPRPLRRNQVSVPRTTPPSAKCKDHQRRRRRRIQPDHHRRRAPVEPARDLPRGVGRGALKSLAKKKVKIPGDTRFKYQADMLHRCLELKDELIHLFALPSYPFALGLRRWIPT